MKKLLIFNLSQMATPMGNKLRKGKEMGQLNCIKDAAIYIEDGIIKKTGTTDEVLESIDTVGCTMINAKGKCAVPGFVDSHTHFIFGGYRQEEFIKRIQGAEYLEIMEMGGGIQATVDATRRASFEQLYTDGKNRVREMLEQGVTTVEGKSGYGLDLDCELRQLRVMEKLDKEEKITIVPTYLGGHAVPREYEGNGDQYIDDMIEKVLPRIKEEKLAKYCDIFCEDKVFDRAQSERLLRAAKDMGFGLKIHADEITSLNGAALAAELGAVSADHLLKITDEEIQKLAASNTTATLLPCTAFCLDKPYAPGRKLIDAGCGVALASDFNPGSCFCNSIPLLLSLAVIQMKMTIEEAICALTLNGAAALGMAESVGSLEEGKKADINLLGYSDYRFLVYHTGANIIDTVIKEGEIVYEKH